MDKEIIDTTFPLWTIIVIIIGSLGTAAWTLIKMYFLQISHNEKMSDLKREIESVEKVAELSLKTHKEETNKRVEEISSEIKSTRDILIEVRTMCNLLIADRIKT